MNKTFQVDKKKSKFYMYGNFLPEIKTPITKPKMNQTLQQMNFKNLTDPTTEEVSGEESPEVRQFSTLNYVTSI